MTEPILLVLYVLVFPGLLFLFGYALLFQYIDRKVVARLQNRVGPPFLQPIADLIKLLSKEDIVPEGADSRTMRTIPLLAFAAVTTAFLYVPVFGTSPLAFSGDLIVVLYLMTLPTILIFLVGWTSRNIFATVGGARAVTQLFIYEVPFFLALLGPALAAGSWSISGIVEWQRAHTWPLIVQPIGLVVGIICLQAKLERTPFDIPDAETEIVAGPFTELTGRKLAVIRLSLDMALIVGSAIIVALFLGGPSIPWTTLPWTISPGWLAALVGFSVFALKTLAILFLLTLIKSGMGRLRIDQLNDFGWKYLATAAVVQILMVLVVNAWVVL